MLLGVLLAAAPALAADVLVPEATPASLSDFAVAYMVYDMVATQLRDRDVSVSDGEDIAGWAGEDAEACFDNDACPANLWGRSDARLAVVLSVGQESSALLVEGRIYARNRAAPVKVVQERVAEGTEEAFAVELAGVVVEALRASSLPAASSSLEEEELPPSTSRAEERSTPTREEKPKTEKPKTEKPKTENSKTENSKTEKPPAERESSARSSRPEGELTSKERAEQKSMGIPEGAYRRYRASGEDREEWLASARVRTGRGHVDVSAGVGVGDVDRGYSAWVLLENVGGSAEVASSSTWLGEGSGVGAFAVVGAGFTPFWFLDLNLVAGVQQGTKYLESGWECPECEADTQLVTIAYEPRAASQLLLEPRVRIWLLPTGIAKPYAQVGFQLRVFDGFEVPSSTVAWPTAPGGVGTGLTLGAGAAFDVTPGVSITVEVPYTLSLSPKPVATTSPSIGTTPTQLDGFGGVVRFALGASVVF